jgi:hypothetical protein
MWGKDLTNIPQITSDSITSVKPGAVRASSPPVPLTIGGLSDTGERSHGGGEKKKLEKFRFADLTPEFLRPRFCSEWMSLNE